MVKFAVFDSTAAYSVTVEVVKATCIPIILKGIIKLHVTLTRLEHTVASSLYLPMPVMNAVLSAKLVSKETSYTTEVGSGSIHGCSSGKASVSKHATLVRASFKFAILFFRAHQFTDKYTEK